jgi:hypothetical protein
VSFDDDSEEDLFVFSGNDLLISHYDVADLDWLEVAERSLIDERRGLVIMQVAVLEDLVDEFILYLADPDDLDAFRTQLSRRTIGPRLDMLESYLDGADLLDREAGQHLSELRLIVDRRNRLAHGTIRCRPTGLVQIQDLGLHDVELEWVLVDRRSGETERISMAALRQELLEAVGAFSALLAYAEAFVRRALGPTNYLGGQYLGVPTP